MKRELIRVVDPIYRRERIKAKYEKGKKKKGLHPILFGVLLVLWLYLVGAGSYQTMDWVLKKYFPRPSVVEYIFKLQVKGMPQGAGLISSMAILSPSLSRVCQSQSQSQFQHQKSRR